MMFEEVGVMFEMVHINDDPEGRMDMPPLLMVDEELWKNIRFNKSTKNRCSKHHSASIVRCTIPATRSCAPSTRRSFSPSTASCRTSSTESFCITTTADCHTTSNSDISIACYLDATQYPEYTWSRERQCR